MTPAHPIRSTRIGLLLKQEGKDIIIVISELR
jgi:hypothetical protein